MNTCETCKAYDAQHSICRVHAPVFHIGIQGGVFPTVAELDWCLEWRSKEPVVRGSKSKGKRQINDTDGITEKHRALAKSLNIDIGPAWGAFKNYCLAHDKRYANFEAAFRNWLASPLNQHGGKR